MGSNHEEFLENFFSEMRHHMDYTDATDLKTVHLELMKKIPLGVPVERDTIFAEGETKESEHRTKTHIAAVAMAQGPRERMEDEHLVTEIALNPDIFKASYAEIFAIFDGHGGQLCAKYVKEILAEKLQNGSNSCKTYSELEFYNMLRRTFVLIDKSWKELPLQQTEHRDTSGTTANLCLIIGNDLWIVNVGDSRAILVKGNKAIQLSEEAKATVKKYEKEIYLRGGNTRQGRVVYETGSLDMARSIGDIDIFAVSALPTIKKMDISLLKESDFQLVLACDGLWDVVSPQMAAKVCYKAKTAMDAAITLRSIAFARGTSDNVSIMVVRPLSI